MFLVVCHTSEHSAKPLSLNSTVHMTTTIKSMTEVKHPAEIRDALCKAFNPRRGPIEGNGCCDPGGTLHTQTELKNFLLIKVKMLLFLLFFSSEKYFPSPRPSLKRCHEMTVVLEARTLSLSQY